MIITTDNASHGLLDSLHKRLARTKAPAYTPSVFRIATDADIARAATTDRYGMKPGASTDRYGRPVVHRDGDAFVVECPRTGYFTLVRPGQPATPTDTLEQALEVLKGDKAR